MYIAVTRSQQKEDYPGWTKVALSAIVEVYDGLRRGRSLEDYHKSGQVYLGNGNWSQGMQM
jgi:hypothetical protein